MLPNQKSCLSLLSSFKTKLNVQEYLDITIEWLGSLGLEPDLAAVHAPGLSGKAVPFGRIRHRLTEDAVNAASHGSIVKLFPGSEDVSDPEVAVSFSTRRGDALISVAEPARHIAESEWISLATRLHHAIHFVYGYAYSMPNELGPEWYAHGTVYQVGVGGLRHEEELRTRWSHVLMEPTTNPRNQCLRQVYRLQFLSDDHLQLNMRGITLRQWIEANERRGRLFALAKGIWTWSIKDGIQVLSANEALFAAGLLSAWDPRLAGAITT